MIKLYKLAERWWFANIPDKIRFILVGGFNTVVSYLIFVSLCHICPYEVALIITYALGINLSIFTMRYYVFSGKSNLAKQYVKALVTYVIMIVGNYIFLYIFIDIYKQAPWLAQAEYTVVSTIALYLAHKKINFK